MEIVAQLLELFVPIGLRLTTKNAKDTKGCLSLSIFVYFEFFVVHGFWLGTLRVLAQREQRNQHCR